MSIVRCVHCQEEVRVPQRVSPQALVECPRCGQQFELSLALEKLPPLLIVLNDPGAIAEETTGSSDSPEMAVPKFEFEEREAPAPFAVSRPASSGSMASRARRRESSSGGILSVVAVLGGGLCALPLAQLVLWWVFGQDPVDLGPKVASYASFLVPQKLRGTADPSSWDENQEPAEDDSDETPVRPRPERVPPERTPSTPETPSDSSDDQASNDEAMNDDGLGPSPLDNPVPVRPVRSRPAQLDDLEAATADQLSELLSLAILAQDDWLDAESFSEDERASRLDAFYQTYAEIAEALVRYTPSDPSNDTTLGSIDQALRFELDQGPLRRFLANRADQVFGEPDAMGKGVALVGRVERVESDEDFDVIVLKLGDGEGKVVRVASWLPLPSSIAEGDSIAVFGKVDSAENLGWDPQTARGSVVLGGYLIMLSSSEN